MGWQNKSTDYAAGYVVTNNIKGSYLQVAIYKSTNSKGTLKAGFDSEWQDLIVKGCQFEFFKRWIKLIQQRKFVQWGELGWRSSK